MSSANPFNPNGDEEISRSHQRIAQFSGLSSPKLRGSLALAYEGEPISVRATVRYTGPGTYGRNFVNCTTGCPVSTVNNRTVDDNTINGAMYLDTSFTYNVKGDVEEVLDKTIASQGGQVRGKTVYTYRYR